MNSFARTRLAFELTRTVRYFLLGTVGTLLLTVFGASPALAQVGQVNGIVLLKESADQPGKPLPDVKIIIIRKDIKGRWETKTDKKGKFLYTLPMFGTYVVCAAGQPIRPQIAPGFRLGSEPKELTIEVVGGDGTVPTDEQILASVAPAGGGGLTKEQQEELDKMNAERERIKAENAKAEADFGEMKKHFDAGLALDAKKDYEGAVNEYRQAEALDKTQHAVYGNMSQAMYNLGATKFNQKLRDDACKLFLESAQTAEKAFSLASGSAKAAELQPSMKSYRLFAARSYALVGQYCSTLGVGDAIDKAIANYKATAELETDPKTKTKYTLEIGKLYFNLGQIDTAMTTYREVLQGDPANVEAMYNLAIALSTDPAKSDEAAKLFDDVASKATDEKMKSDAAAFAETLKAATKPGAGGKKKK